ncbi:hypothetical protein AVEN_32092-1 [Araneus ventricosus]|uniref:Uncharacterized protein n=1 Tax=Araneus ventricosus TaxID=182803 RepID=A0A4Y2EG77_ARAVE|nr:hypothetical protein AVEN_32092-1 [Araneus ventricosus]
MVATTVIGTQVGELTAVTDYGPTPPEGGTARHRSIVMPYGPANLIDAPYGQFVYNYTHPRKSVCSVAFKHIARGQDDLTEARTDL